MSRTAVTPPGPGEPHKNLTSLAAELGFSVPALSKWRNNYPDCPTILQADLWREFMARNGLGNRPGAGRPSNKSRDELTNAKLETEVRLNEIKIAKEERKLIPAEEVESFLLFAGSKFKSAVFQMVAEVAPKCAGLEAGEIRGIMRGHADAVCMSMQTTVEDWNAEQDEARRAAEQATTHHE